MRKIVKRLTATPLGHLVYRPIQVLIHLSRRLRHPDIPIDHTVTRVSYRQRKFSIVHRRWNSSDKLAIAQCFAQNQYDMPSGAHGALVERIYLDIVASGKKPLIVDCGKGRVCLVPGRAGSSRTTWAASSTMTVSTTTSEIGPTVAQG